MPPCLRALCALVLLVGCATSADPVEVRRKPKRATTATADPAPPPVDAGAPDHTAAAAIQAAPPEPFGDVGFNEVSEKDWLAGVREKVSREQKVDPAELRFSEGRLRVAFVRSPAVAVPAKPSRGGAPRRHRIIVVDNQGRPVSAFRPVTIAYSDEPPKDLRFLSEERLVYEVVAPPTTAATPAPKKRKGKTKGRTAAAPEKPALPTRLFVIQPIAPGARPIRCKGLHFAFSQQHDRLAFVGGEPESGFVAVDGEQVYPRRGRTIVSSAPVWSKDGRSLAFLESPAEKPARLVLLAELDNPTGDTTWDLPPTTSIDGTRVFWGGSGKLLVGKTAMRPVFSASFVKETPRN